MTGKFIVVEGGEGAGKTTLVNRLKECFPGDGFVFTREPGGTPFAEDMRKVIFANNDDPFKELCLFFAARRDHVLKCIRPAIEQGKHVICDRYVASTYAYQIIAPQNWYLEDGFASLVHYAEASRNPEPRNPGQGTVLHTNYLWLDGEVNVCLGRRRKEGEQTSFDSRPIKFHEGVRRGFKHFFEFSKCQKMHFAEPSWMKINAELSADEIFEQARKAIEVIMSK